MISNPRKNIINGRKGDKIEGSLVGGAIGDALGYQIEFSRGIKEKQITKYNNDYGIISDDTQMTLFTANALISRETKRLLKDSTITPVDAIYLGYLDWLETQQIDYKNSSSITWIKKIPELNDRRAPGTTCMNALKSGMKGTIDKPINNSKGCGTIMRIAPIGLYYENPKEVGKIAAEASALTHGHPLGIIPSYVTAVLINILLNSEKNIEQALKEALKIYNKKFNIFDKSYKKEFMNITNKAIELSKSNIADSDAIKELGEGWVAEEAFAIAIYSCLKYSNSVQNALICAINHDGDSDSTGAVAGNIIGAYLGYSNIPNYYVKNLELKDIILEIASDLSVEVPIKSWHSRHFQKHEEYWLSKYLYGQRERAIVFDFL